MATSNPAGQEGSSSATVPPAATGTGDVESPGAHGASFGEWLATIPKTFALLTAGIAALLGLFAPERLVPEPLQGLRVMGTLLAAVGFLLAWAWKDAIRRRLRAFITATAALVFVVALLNVFLVHEVRIPTDAPQPRYFILGPTVADPQFQGAFPNEIIGQEGDNWTALRSVWGTGFVVVAVLYSLCYVLLLPALVMSISGTDVGSSRRHSPAKGGGG